MRFTPVDLDVLTITSPLHLEAEIVSESPPSDLESIVEPNIEPAIKAIPKPPQTSEEMERPEQKNVLGGSICLTFTCGRKHLDRMLPLLDSLWKDLAYQIEELGGPLHFVVFTGDVGYSGKSDEYRLAKKHFFRPLLKTTGVAPERLFLVPGNHDVDWRVTDLLNTETLRGMTGADTFDRLLEDQVASNVLLAPLAAYSTFVRDFRGKMRTPATSRNPRYSYTSLLEVGSAKVAITGLNSALLSGIVRTSDGKRLDRGNLRLGARQLAEIQDASDRGILSIVIAHHPLDWLQESDSHQMADALASRGGLFLCGSLHSPRMEFHTLQGRAMVMTAGCLHDSPSFAQAYYLAQLNLQTGEGVVHLRSFSPALRRWVADVVYTGDELHGAFRLDLRHSIKR